MGVRVAADQRGFTLVEVMVAAFILLVGILGTIKLIDAANATTVSTKQREAGVNLTREVVEDVHSIPYEALTANSVVPQLQSQPGLEDMGAGGGWTIRRRGTTFNVAVGACTVDDPKDGLGSHDQGIFCATGDGSSDEECDDLLEAMADGDAGDAHVHGEAAIGECGIDIDLDGEVDDLLESEVCLTLPAACEEGTADANPQDYKRVVTNVWWQRNGVVRSVRQTTLVNNPGSAVGPAVRSLQLDGVSQPVTDPATGSAPFTFTTSSQPATVSWMLDGEAQGTATMTSATAGGFSWPISGSVRDGSYTVAVRAFNDSGIAGASRSMTVTLNRYLPTAPDGFAAGRNNTIVDFEWLPNPERDLSGYRVYRENAGGDVRVCELTTATECYDANPPGGPATYYVVAVDRDPVSGDHREGAHSATKTVVTTNNPPNPPTVLVASVSNGTTILRWTPPSPADPDPGDSIDFYRIYRDGSLYADRYDRTGSGTEVTYTDIHTGGDQHTYWVTAVDTQLAESTLLGPVTR